MEPWKIWRGQTIDIIQPTTENSTTVHDVHDALNSYYVECPFPGLNQPCPTQPQQGGRSLAPVPHRGGVSWSTDILVQRLWWRRLLPQLPIHGLLAPDTGSSSPTTTPPPTSAPPMAPPSPSPSPPASTTASSALLSSSHAVVVSPSRSSASPTRRGQVAWASRRGRELSLHADRRRHDCSWRSAGR